MFDKSQLMSMASGMLPQMVLGNFGSVLLGAIAAYDVLYFFAGPHRFFYRVAMLIVVQVIAYVMSVTVARSIAFCSRWLQGHTRIGGKAGGKASTIASPAAANAAAANAAKGKPATTTDTME